MSNICAKDHGVNQTRFVVKHRYQCSTVVFLQLDYVVDVAQLDVDFHGDVGEIGLGFRKKAVAVGLHHTCSVHPIGLVGNPLELVVEYRRAVSACRRIDEDHDASAEDLCFLKALLELSNYVCSVLVEVNRFVKVAVGRTLNASLGELHQELIHNPLAVPFVHFIEDCLWK